MSVCIHEIVCGNGIRPQAYTERCTWLPACGQHNQSGCGFHNVQAMPLARQYALKQWLDGEQYDLLRINALRGRSRETITEDEVQDFLV